MTRRRNRAGLRPVPPAGGGGRRWSHGRRRPGAGRFFRAALPVLLLGAAALVAAWDFGAVPMAPWPAAAADTVTGTARAIDGDTLRVGTVRIRLHGIDAPESAQNCTEASGRTWPCGREATRALRGLVEGRGVRCTVHDTDPYGRAVAVCHVSGTDINAWMVSAGHALAHRRYSRDYVRQETAARAGRRGMWRGTFDAPWDWRRAPETAPALRTGGDCIIKGNISSSGERIYHVPGQTWYGRTRISEARGERCFRSEAEARAAGWRRARR